MIPVKLQTLAEMKTEFSEENYVPQSINWFRRWRTDKANFYSLYSAVTLKTRSRSRQSNRLF